MKAWVILVLSLIANTALAQSLTLSPAVVPLGGKPGQSTQQHLRLFNGTSQKIAFDLHAKDVAVRGGRRVFVDPGELAGSVAATAVFSTRHVVVAPGDEAEVDVTLTLPSNIQQRAVVLLFQSATRIGDSKASVSIGTLVTFDLAGTPSVTPGELVATPPTASTNAAVSVPLVNDGSEPMIVRGAAAILDERGALRGKVILDQRRLLPGETSALAAELASELSAGTYRVVATIESGKRVWTRTIALTVP